MHAPPVVEDFGGWYLRGDIGFSNQRVDRLNNPDDARLTSSSQNLTFNTAGIFGLGAGYKFNNWFRADVTGEWRGNSRSSAKTRSRMSVGSAPIPITAPSRSGGSCQRLRRSRHLVVRDPFIGAGVGGAGFDRELSRSEPRHRGRPGAAGLAADNVSKCGARALHAGLAYRLRRTSPSNSPTAISTWATA
jgi:hypothetical protein